VTTTPAAAPALDLRPRPGRAPTGRILARQAAMEIRLTLRRGEAVVITMVVPLLALIGVGRSDVIRVPGDRLGFVVPGTIALAVMSTAFTGQAISTGYERSYGVLKRLGTSPLSVPGLLAAKTAAVCSIIAGQVMLLAVAGGLLGWRPRLAGGAAGLAAAVVLIALATAAFCGFALLMAGTLRAEATAGAANLVYLLFVVGGGLLFPLPAHAPGLRWLPTAALAEGLRAVLAHGTAAPAWCWVDLVGWAVVGVAAAARWFRWQ
jgi:ABC-2 type transport system permease protein